MSPKWTFLEANQIVGWNLERERAGSIRISLGSSAEPVNFVLSSREKDSVTAVEVQDT